jgi:hypothetical protein
MDVWDRIESRDPLAIREHLVFAFDEWIAELIRLACDDDSPETRDAVIKAVHIHDAFAARSLTPAHLAELAEGAAGSMEPRWPENPGDADEVDRLLGARAARAVRPSARRSGLRRQQLARRRDRAGAARGAAHPASRAPAGSGWSASNSGSRSVCAAPR